MTFREKLGERVADYFKKNGLTIVTTVSIEEQVAKRNKAIGDLLGANLEIKELTETINEAKKMCDGNDYQQNQIWYKLNRH